MKLGDVALAVEHDGALGLETMQDMLERILGLSVLVPNEFPRGLAEHIRKAIADAENFYPYIVAVYWYMTETTEQVTSLRELLTVVDATKILVYEVTPLYDYIDANKQSVKGASVALSQLDANFKELQGHLQAHVLALSI